ncbi:MAG: hypothetical protein HFI21_01700 [Lachnospiraceae bacterium]|nr:hypothetical protein [Lachnospiraceae bacterium]
MADTLLRLEDLKIGMNVKMEQLKGIFGVCIYFDDYSPEKGGNIIYISHKPYEYDEGAAKAVEENGGILATFVQNEEDGDYECYE